MEKAFTYVVCEKCQSMNRVEFDSRLGKASICGKCKNPLSLHNGVSDLISSTLDTLTRKSPIPVLIDFWAPWCGPCRAFAPTFLTSADRLKGKIVFGKVNTEANSGAGHKFGVRGIPTLVAFSKGQEVGRISGALPLEEFEKWIKQSFGTSLES